MVRIEETDGGGDDGSVATNGIPTSLNVEVVEVGTDTAFGITILVIALETRVGGDCRDPDTLGTVKASNGAFVFDGIVFYEGVGEGFASSVIGAIKETRISSGSSKGRVSVFGGDEDVLTNVSVGEDFSVAGGGIFFCEEVKTTGIDDKGLARNAEATIGGASSEERIAVAFVIDSASEEARIFTDYTTRITAGGTDSGGRIGLGNDVLPEIAEIVGGDFFASGTVSGFGIGFSEIGIVNEAESFGLGVDFLTCHSGF